MSKKTVNIYTDGACSGNPGIGGWAAILTYMSYEKEISGYDLNTTNNKMELMAAISALKLLREKCIVELYTDSIYVKDGINKWLISWINNNWKTAAKKPVKNLELWQELYELTKYHDVRWHWVKGHNGHEYNERADKLARAEILNIKKKEPV